MSYIKIATSGSVDDGKSTLMAKLLLETNNIYKDQLATIAKLSEKKGFKEIDLSLILDGLESERKQGITIDVAFRYFKYKNKKFILSDNPGHMQYTKNMITGASNADIGIVLIDATKGLLEQSKKHILVLLLLKVEKIIFIINKMDLINFSSQNFYEIKESILSYFKDFDLSKFNFIPASALIGDNITKTSLNMSWYNGPTLLDEIYNFETNKKISSNLNYSIQVISKKDSKRVYLGKLLSGNLNKNQEYLLLPQLTKITIQNIYSNLKNIDSLNHTNNSLDYAAVELDKEIDIEKGNLICDKNNLPFLTNSFKVNLFWFDQNKYDENKTYILKLQGQEVFVKSIQNINLFKISDLTFEESNQINLNNILTATIYLHKKIIASSFDTLKELGNFILIDAKTKYTCGAGLINSQNEFLKQFNYSTNIHPVEIRKKEDWELRNKHKSFVLWLTGLSASGKTTIAKLIESFLFENQKQVIHLDGDNLRDGICSNLGFSEQDRDENIRRAAHISKLFANQGNIVISTFITPLNTQQKMVREIMQNDNFIEIFIDCPIETCIQRDPKNLYQKAINGEIKAFTGISSKYEPPTNPELIINTNAQSIHDSFKNIINFLIKKELI